MNRRTDCIYQRKRPIRIIPISIVVSSKELVKKETFYNFSLFILSNRSYQAESSGQSRFYKKEKRLIFVLSKFLRKLIGNFWSNL